MVSEKTSDLVQVRTNPPAGEDSDILSLSGGGQNMIVRFA
jgi:hypothetical protein